MRVLLDVHIGEAVAAGLRRDGTDALGMADWRGGDLRTAKDDEILLAAAEDDRVFVTYDERVQVLLREWARSGQHHSGVIFVSNRTITQGDVGMMLRALRKEIEEHGDQNWSGRSVFLRRPDQ